jgi:hypothetical protein
MTENAHKTVENGGKRSETVENAQKQSRTISNGHGNGQVTVRNGERSGTLNGQGRWTVRDVERSGTLNGQERLGTFESLRSNALERIVENVHVHVSKTKETL